MVDFATPYSTDEHVVMLRRPDDSSRVTLYLEPLKTEVWLCIALTLVVSGFFIWGITNYSPFYQEAHTLRKHKSGLFSFGNCLWLMYGSILNQGKIQEFHKMNFLIY